MKRAYFFILGILIICISWLDAGTTGKISGKVTDQETGDPLAGVNVILEGTNQGAATNSDGYYVILNVSPGAYTLKAMMIGYATKVFEDVRVEIDLTRVVNIEMETEVLQGEIVEVVAQRKIVREDVASSQLNITTDEIENLPAMSIEEIITTQAGVEGLSVREGGEDELALIMDGATLKDDRTGRPITGIPLSSVKEIMVQSGGFSAQYSDLQAGVVNIVTKEGNVRNYNIDLQVRYSPPAPKHFGESVYDPNSYFMRPWLDDAVCWTGTDNGNWDRYMQERYPSFDGWVEKANARMSNDNPNDDLTPAALQRLFRYQHRRNGYIVDPDYNLDLGLGGPVPVIGPKLGNLRFFSSLRTVQSMYLVPLQRDRYYDWSWTNKVTSNIMENMKLQVGTFMKNVSAVSSSGSGNPYIFESLWDVAGAFGSSSQQRSKLFYPEYYCPSDIYNRMINVKLTHSISNKTFYEVLAEFAATRYSTNPGAVRDATRDYDILPGPESYFVSEAPWGFETDLSAESVDGFMMGGKSNSRDSTRTSRFKLRFDMISQVNRYNQVKVGFIFEKFNYNMNYGAINPALPVGRPWTDWNAYPYQTGLYIEDKLEFEGWVGYAGLRVEYFEPNTNWYHVDPYYRPLFSSNWKPEKEDEIPKNEADGLMTFLPRLGISHPITTNSKLYFNYGHMRQRFSPDQLFGVRRVTSGRMSTFGNPELPMEKTIAYELGYDHALFEKLLIHVAAYYKDKTDQAGTVGYYSADNTVRYSRYTNNFYQDIRGLEIELRKSRGYYFTGFVNYNYSVYTSGRFGLLSYYQDPAEQQKQKLNVSAHEQYKPIPVPKVKFNFSLHTPSKPDPLMKQLLVDGWRISLRGHWRAGSYTTYGNVIGVINNVRWRDSYNVDMKLTKTFRYKKLQFTFLTEIYNVFNFKHLSFAGLGDSYLTPQIYQKYMESLHFKAKVYDELGEKHIAGNDKVGDYRPLNVEYQPMTYQYRIDPQFSGVAGMIYKAEQIDLDLLDQAGLDLSDYTIMNNRIIDFNEYVQKNSDGSYSIVSRSKIDKIIGDKAYIFNPANESFMFLHPRDVYLGIKISYEL